MEKLMENEFDDLLKTLITLDESSKLQKLNNIYLKHIISLKEYKTLYAYLKLDNDIHFIDETQ